MKLSVGQITKLLGISAKALHYYDEIGLVKPTETSETGYRYYDSDALSKLQQVMFYRELEFSLKEISQFFDNPNYNKHQTLKSHRELLILKRQHIDDLISIIDNTIGGNQNMTNKIGTSASDIIEAKKKYADEVRECWGKTKEYEENARKQENYSKNDILFITAEADKILYEFSSNLDKCPDDLKIQSLVSKWQKYISKYHYECSLQMLSFLGNMYVNDERFRKNIDRFGDGTAQLMSEAIKVYCNNMQ